MGGSEVRVHVCKIFARVCASAVPASSLFKNHGAMVVVSAGAGQQCNWSGDPYADCRACCAMCRADYQQCQQLRRWRGLVGRHTCRVFVSKGGCDCNATYVTRRSIPCTSSPRTRDDKNKLLSPYGDAHLVGARCRVTGLPGKARSMP